jgi:hypothetical protein
MQHWIDRSGIAHQPPPTPFKCAAAWGWPADASALPVAVKMTLGPPRHEAEMDLAAPGQLAKAETGGPAFADAPLV